ANLKVKSRSIEVKRLPIGATGRYFLRLVPIQEFEGTVFLNASATAQTKWTGVVAIDPAGTPVTVSFSGLPRAKATVAVHPSRHSAAIPTITSLTDGGGTE